MRWRRAVRGVTGQATVTAGSVAVSAEAICVAAIGAYCCQRLARRDEGRTEAESAIRCAEAARVATSAKTEAGSEMAQTRSVASARESETDMTGRMESAVSGETRVSESSAVRVVRSRKRRIARVLWALFSPLESGWWRRGKARRVQVGRNYDQRTVDRDTESVDKAETRAGTARERQIER